MADQPVQTATGQAYGQARQQEEAQRAMPLPSMNPGEAGDFLRPTERPGESIMTPPSPAQAPPPKQTGDSSWNQKLAVMLPYLLEEASRPTASPQTRYIVNQLSYMITPPDSL